VKARTTLLVFCLSVLTTQCANNDADPKPAPGDAPQPAPPKVDDPEGAAAAVRVPIDGLPAFGNARALVTLVAFTDYECQYCAKADDTLATLRRDYGDRLRVVVANRPLPMHERAAPAARAFLAAAELGKAEAMHARLFASKTKDLGEDGLRAAARDVGLDLATFDRSRTGSTTEAALARSEKIATALGVNGTPTFFVNGRRLMGARPIEAFRALIDEELGKAQALVGKGVPLENVYASILAAAPEYVPSKAALEPDSADPVGDVGTDGAPVRGSARAPVTVVLFADFECPYCVRAVSTLRGLVAANPDALRIAFRQRPLPMHPHARLAAKASIAADRQGRFWDYHDVLFAHRDALERTDLEGYATQVGLDRGRFDKDLDDPEVEALVAADEARAQALGVRGVPTSFVNGRRITGAQPAAVWVTAVQKSLTTLHLPSDGIRADVPSLPLALPLAVTH
jgi:protein-disulfide isomerase